MNCVKEIVRKSLSDNGYDGLVCAGISCGCALDDLMPCGDPNIEECSAAYKWTPEQAERFGMPVDGGYSEFKFIMHEEKPPVQEKEAGNNGHE